jgi:hypothetical protein
MSDTTTTLREADHETDTGMRRDSAGVWHLVATTPCEECGCPYAYSLDEFGIVWEAGPNIGDGCLDDMCGCHVIPVMGLLFNLHLAS